MDHLLQSPHFNLQLSLLTSFFLFLFTMISLKNLGCVLRSCFKTITILKPRISKTHLQASIKLVNFPNTTAYCNCLKLIVDEFGNVDTPINNSRLMIRIFSSLSKTMRVLLPTYNMTH